MKRTVVAVGAAALSLGLLGSPAFADSENWSSEKADQVAINRCANAGIGNDGETINNGGCVRRIDYHFAGELHDDDPGNSRDHNANSDHP